jgi:hypothetical protein
MEEKYYPKERGFKRSTDSKAFKDTEQAVNEDEED